MAVFHLLTFPSAVLPDYIVLGTDQSARWIFNFWYAGYAILALIAIGLEIGGRRISAAPLMCLMSADQTRLRARHSLPCVAARRRRVSLGGAKARDGAAVEIEGACIEASQHHAVEHIRHILLP
jgi:hypothetical protein